MEIGGSYYGPKDHTFIDLVLSWSARHIFDDNLFKPQVYKIPDSFESVDAYLDSYAYPLLEETRADLASAMETLHEAPFAEIKAFAETKKKAFHYDVKVESWENRKSECGGEPYKTLPGDIVMVANAKPETVSDLDRAGWNYTLACVMSIPPEEVSEEEGCESCSFEIRTAGPVDFGNEQNTTLSVVYLMNVMTNKRIWNALRMSRNLRIIKKVLSKDDLGEEDCKLCPPKLTGEMREKIEPNLLTKLNESQLEAILVSLSRTDCFHKPSVELIWGPPGTGKTTTVSVLLYTLLRMNVRTLICAPTNVAIKELASRVSKLVRSSAESEDCFGSFPLGDMLIFGNKDRLKVGSDIEEIYLDNRVKRLVECLTPFTGWKHCVDSMLDFLLTCVSQHQRNEILKSNQNSQDQLSESKSLLEFARDRFSLIAEPLRECMSTFLTHLPRRFIGRKNFQNIRQLMLHLDSIERLLSEDSSMTCDELESVFLGSGSMVGVKPFSDNTSSLVYVRVQCMVMLRDLRVSLGVLSLPDLNRTEKEKPMTTELCFQQASLIFCTTSSSFRLHSVEMDPFSLLIIDEAAQVKECESIIPLQMFYVRHAVLVGDECQLPAMVKSPLSQEAGFGRSLFERLSSLGHSKHLLDLQYRMHPSISRFPNSKFYMNQILDATCVQSRSYERCYLQGRMFGPYSL